MSQSVPSPATGIVWRHHNMTISPLPATGIVWGHHNMAISPLPCDTNSLGTSSCRNQPPPPVTGIVWGHHHVAISPHPPLGEIEYFSPLGKSDHCVITLNILCKVITNKYTKKRKLFNKANYEGMRKEFSDIEWEECKDKVNDQWEILKTVLTLLEDKHVPQNEV